MQPMPSIFCVCCWHVVIGNTDDGCGQFVFTDKQSGKNLMLVRALNTC